MEPGDCFDIRPNTTVKDCMKNVPCISLISDDSEVEETQTNYANNVCDDNFAEIVPGFNFVRSTVLVDSANSTGTKTIKNDFVENLPCISLISEDIQTNYVNDDNEQAYVNSFTEILPDFKFLRNILLYENENPNDSVSNLKSGINVLTDFSKPQNCNIECKFCSRLFPSKKKHRIHRCQHLKYRPNNIFAKTSNAPTEKKKLYTKEKKKNETIRILSCVHCNKEFIDKNKLYVHILSHSNESPKRTKGDKFQTKICALTDVSKDQNYNVISKDKDELKKWFKCDQCDFFTLKRFMIKRHQSKHHGKIFKKKKAGDKNLFSDASKGYKCKMCTYCTRYRNKMIKHNRTHVLQKCYKCNICDYFTVKRSKLIRHEKNHRNSNKEYKSTKNNFFTSYKCNQCEFTTHKNSALTKHIRSKHGSNSHFKTTTEPQILRHVHKHSKLMPYKCRHCNYVTFSKPCIDYHNSKNHFECDICAYVTRYKFMLQDHKLSHFSHPFYQCHICLYIAKNQNDILKHKERHGNLIIHKCNECGYVTKYKSVLNRHIAQHISKLNKKWEMYNALKPCYVKLEKLSECRMYDENSQQRKYNIKNCFVRLENLPFQITDCC